MAKDVTAVLAAESVHADLFITERQYLFESQFEHARETSIVAPEDALSIIGLYLRQHSTFLIRNTGQYIEKHSRDAFWMTAARELVPEASRWWTACRLYSLETDDEGLSFLVGALLQRIERAIRARDGLLATLMIPQDNETASDASEQLDQICLWLMGAFDVAAKVAHLVCQISDDVGYIGWQHRRWRKELSKQCPELAKLVDGQSDGHHVMNILTSLRNCIHGEALQTIGLLKGQNARETMLGLPPRDKERVLTAMQHLGGVSTWGVSRDEPNFPMIHPGILIEELLPRVFSLLDALLSATPIEQIDGARLTVEVLAALQKKSSPFGQDTRQRIRWQLGISLD
jgi:hypothetical protein